MMRQRGLAVGLCVLVMLAGQAHAQKGPPPNESEQYMTGKTIGPLYHSSDEILERLNQLASSPLPVRLVQ
jgi:hypothetical protein